MVFRKHFDYDAKAASDEAAIPADGHGDSLTIQSQSEDADINEMMRRFKVTGQLPVDVRAPTYGDFEGVSSYQDAIHAIMQAQESFDRMPADVRAKFENDPGKFVDFCSDPANIDAMREMGLAVPKENSNVGSGTGSPGVPPAGGDSGASGAGS